MGSGRASRTAPPDSWSVVVSLLCQTLPPAELEPAVATAMWELFSSYYTGTTQAAFEADARAKDTLFLVWQGPRLVGFNSLRSLQVDGESVMISGDLLMATEVRSLASASLFRAWAAAIRNRCDWWCSLASGPRTFRLPFLFFRRVTPGIDGEETADERDRRHRFARAAYGSAYDETTGIVRLPQAYTLRPDKDWLREEYPLDSIFRNRNPGWTRGDELVSLVSLQPHNWSPRALRLLGNGESAT